MGRLVVEIGRDVSVRTSSGRALPLSTRHEGLLLGALSLAKGGELDREALAKRLWPAAGPEAARVSFRQRLASLRRLPGLKLDADRRAVSLNLASILLLEDRRGEAWKECRSLADACAFGGKAGAWDGARAAAWVEEALSGEVLGPLPTGLDLEGTMLRVRDESLSVEERLALAAVCSQASAGQAGSAGAREMALLFGDSEKWEWALGPLGLIFEAAALASHREGLWGDAVLCAQRARVLYERAGRKGRAVTACFREARMKVDLGLVKEGGQGFADLEQRKALPGRLRGYLDMNLVFLHAMRRDSEGARRAAQRCRSAAGSDEALLSWLCLNEALTLARGGRPRQAALAVLEAGRSVAGCHDPMELFWHWQVACEVFALGGDAPKAVTAHVLASRAMVQRQAHNTPINQRRVDSLLGALASSCQPVRWLEARAESESLPLVLAHSRVTEDLTSFAAKG